MNTPMHQYTIDQLHEARGHWGTVSTHTGISRRTIEKISRGEIPNPGVHSIEVLAEYFGWQSRPPRKPVVKYLERRA